tara:strand:+ start:1001 stop:1306 length:306 start_codon:yes stop_codon:yes gene_type:complete
MNFQVSELVSQLINGLKFYFKKHQIKIGENFYQELMNILNIELSKPFGEQTFTPTQILNDYIKNELNEDLKITPHDLGSELNNSLILWGIEKAKYFDDKSI